MAEGSVRWGYVLAAPGRPPRADQAAHLAGLGIADDEFGPVWEDRISRGSTRPTYQLSGRNELLLAVLPGDDVCVHSEFCAALSKNDARWFIRHLAERDARLVVGGKPVETPEEAEVFAAEVARRQNAHHVSESRKGGKKRRRKKAREVEGPLLPERVPCVYRHFDADGVLLYIGACINHRTREQHHKSQSDWWPLSARVKVEYYDTMREALAAERAAIYFEKPVHNLLVVEPPAGAFVDQAAEMAEAVAPGVAEQIRAMKPKSE